MPIGALLYGVMPEQILFYLLLVIMGSSISTLGLIIFKGVLFLREIFPRETPHPVEISELRDLAKKMKFELSKDPFWEVDKKTIKAKAWGDSKKTKKIIFGREFLDSLTSKERIFVGGHEFLHLYGHQFCYLLLIMIPTVFFMISVLSIFHTPQSIMMLGTFGSIIGCFCFASRSFETIADLNGAA